MRTASLRIFRVGGDQWDQFVWDHLACVYSNGNRATVKKRV
jgi:hypothetical protein